ncbi:alpha-glucan phosphorylase, H isozyme-like [Humulus lupulus]|uniref:alpha-glucan phosphorylase, H isozyme-like n=1 Tax=Humulus lupulus TaxID=3486 RepID=UPI002B40D343|nr:alpha-glucan phosphorylase, H isozyme-like [Humulus lupulus]
MYRSSEYMSTKDSCLISSALSIDMIVSSTAGHEASGTGSMKFLMNGCLLLATADGSTIEIFEEIGAENMFLFGAKLDEVPILRERGPNTKVNLQFARVVRNILTST